MDLSATNMTFVARGEMESNLWSTLTKTSRIRDTSTLSTDADRRTDIILEELRDFFFVRLRDFFLKQFFLEKLQDIF